MTPDQPTYSEVAAFATPASTTAGMRLGGRNASLIAIAERLGVARVATLNHRHSGSCRPTHCDAFELVPWRPQDAPSERRAGNATRRVYR